MKVLIVSLSLQGGAGNSAYRLHQGLQRIGVDAPVLIESPDPGKPEALVMPKSLRMRFLKELGRFSGCGRLDLLPLNFYPRRKTGTFSIQGLPDTLAGVVKKISPDVINLRWVCGGFMKVETVARLHKPLVWTLSDMWPFTGGCHHSENCHRYLDQCGACPKLGSSKENDLSRWIWQRKARAWQAANLTAVAPSSWMAERARASSLFRNVRVEVIPHGLDTGVFKPIPKPAARELLGLPRDKKIILFGAWKNDRRKGFDLLESALHQLNRTGWSQWAILATFGSQPPENGKPLGFEAHHLGHLHDDVSLAATYAAADVMVVPSRWEPFGNTAIEALSCGLPVVAFRATGLKDIVDHRMNGFLAKPFDAEALAAGIIWVLGDGERQARLSQRAREKAMQEYALETCARRYERLFSELLENEKNSQKFALSKKRAFQADEIGQN